MILGGPCFRPNPPQAGDPPIRRDEKGEGDGMRRGFDRGSDGCGGGGGGIVQYRVV